MGFGFEKNAKSFWDLDPATLKAYHKSHISKVMGVCTVAFAYEDNVENGRDALKLDFSRCQSYKVSGKIVQTGRKDENG